MKRPVYIALAAGLLLSIIVASVFGYRWMSTRRETPEIETRPVANAVVEKPAVSETPPTDTEKKSEPPTSATPNRPSRPEPELPGAVGIMIENSTASRPQAGLDKADIVYELEAEYGITRFLALYHTYKAAKIGPVRSARMAFYEIAKAYNHPYGHAGGNPDVFDALARDKELPDLDEIYNCGNCFWRSGDRRPPHNLCTSTDLLFDRLRERGIATSPLYRFPEGELSGGKPALSVRYSWGPETQDVLWEWDGKRYLRSQSGAPHTMESGAQVAVDNLIVIWTRYAWVHKGEWQHDVQVVGSGDGYLFRDGAVLPIKWQKGSRQEHYRFSLADGTEAKLVPGQTWVSVLKSSQHLAFTDSR